MISINFNPLLVWPAVFNLVVILGLWLYYSNRSGWSDQPEPPGSVYRCDACGRVYEDNRQQPRTACPDCGRFNDAVVR